MIESTAYACPRSANLDRNATQSAIYELEAANYWIKRWWSGARHKPGYAKQMATNNRLIRKLKKWLPESPPELNARGNAIERLHLPSMEVAARYAHSKGCTPLPNYTSDGYVNAWKNQQKRIIISYCEGDVCVVTCATDDALLREQFAFFDSIR